MFHIKHIPIPPVDDEDSMETGGDIDEDINCADSRHGCCLDGVTAAADSRQSNCPGMQSCVLDQSALRSPLRYK